MDGLLAAPPLRVVKLGPDRSRVFAWDGRQLERTPEHILLAGFFTRLRRDLGYVVLEQGDLFLEWYYFGRWYNIFQIYSTSGQLKGWYCNIGMPPQLDAPITRVTGTRVTGESEPTHVTGHDESRQSPTAAAND